MVAIRNEIHFLLNDRQVSVADAGSAETLLDFLRLRHRLRGTKEGCAEGDCGACTVLVGRILDGELVYETVNACIRFVGSLDGCHVVTVEHLKRPDGSLHPVQQALVDEHGSQCGFCTPGFVMSLYALWMRNPDPTDEDIETSIQGNLCRCTGYAPILRAAKSASRHASGDDPLVSERERVKEALAGLADGRRVECGPDGDRVIIPADCADLAEILSAHPDATIVAGSTDVGLWVTKFMRDISPVVFIGNLSELHGIEVADDQISVGAGVTYSQLLETVAERIPQLVDYWKRIGGEQIRNMGTVGGNIANGSPIGDTPPPLIALGASVTLRQGATRRDVPLEDFFIDYGKQDRKPDEFVEKITIPLPGADDRYAIYKISKRRDEDISAVCGAIRLTIDGSSTVSAATIAFGGMAATPKRARHAEEVLVGSKMEEADIEAAMQALEKDFQPISDWRASAEYRMLTAKNLLKRFWLEHGQDAVPASLRRRNAA